MHAFVLGRNKKIPMYPKLTTRTALGFVLYAYDTPEDFVCEGKYVYDCYLKSQPSGNHEKQEISKEGGCDQINIGEINEQTGVNRPLEALPISAMDSFQPTPDPNCEGVKSDGQNTVGANATDAQHELSNGLKSRPKRKRCVNDNSRKKRQGRPAMYPKGPLECLICRKVLADVWKLKKHEMVHSGEKPYQCSVCLKKFARSTNLVKHEVVHTGDKGFKCDICHLTFTENGSLKRHFQIHSGKDLVKCKICSKKLSSQYNLDQHVKTVHEGRRDFDCRQCHIFFRVKSSLTKHMLYNHSDLDLSFSCHLCEKKFSKKESMNYHIKRHHTIEKPHECFVCKKRFLDLKDLRVHHRVHTGDRPFKCEICKKAFTQSCTLKKHILIHSDIRPYACVNCGKTFRQKGTLDAHMRTHTGGKPFKCLICEKAFNRKYTLECHIRKHTG